LKQTNDIFDQILGVPQLCIAILTLPVSVVFLAEYLSPAIVSSSLFKVIGLELDGCVLGCIGGDEGIDDFNSPIFQHDFCDF
jgi:hypothetical protein